MQSSSHTIIFIALVIVSVVVLSVDGRLKTKFSQSPELFKSRQGPPSEFGQRQLPKPSQVTQSSDSALIPITLEKQGEQFVWKGQLPFDATQVTISLLSTEAKHMTLTVVDAQKSAEVVDQWIGYNENHGVPAKTYKFDEFKAGMRDLEISCPADLPTLANSDAHVLKLLVFNASPIRVYSHLITYDLSLNREIGVRASLGESKLNRTGVSSHIPSPIRIEDLPNPNGNNAFVVDMDVILPDGQEQVIHMKDDGESADENARDGIWGAKIQATEVGDYVVQVVMKARIDTNKPGANTNQEPLYLYRTSQHVLSVVADALDLLPKATVDVDANDEMIEIVMHAKPETDVAGKKFSAYAEVWGTSSDKKLVPVAWISGMTIAQKQGETVGLKLKLNARWLARAKASFPLKLKNAYVLDVDTAVPLSTISEIDVDHQAGDIKRLMAAHSIYSFDGTITEEMTMGKRPKLLTATTSAAASGHKVILVHGYCSNNNPFSTSDFTNFVEFLDAKQSRSNDEFALLIQQLAANYESVSIVGHSQGGLAALHLLENYWSHLDNAKSTNDYRVIQSVGSPYRGSGLAGTLASIGSVFGVGCGANTDLTHDGAERWLATISAESKKNVYYYTSQYKPYSYCNLAANAVLSWPNDGTTELDYANLDGANKQAHLQGYCHTADMKYPPQCQNHDQNQEINSFAHP